ncbi:MAG: hypothetical protein AMS24_03835 [Chlamydiae bacterium SM23_39]|nr:MAG: hypothetical protein AMS24_03835 [Chlamydiae bacterium SM23_39]
MEVRLDNVEPKKVEPPKNHLNPKLASVVLCAAKIEQMGNGVISELKKIDEYSHQKNLLLKLRSKVDKNFNREKLSEEDKKILSYLEEKGLHVSSKEEIDHHLSHLNLLSEMEFRKIHNEMSERASLATIGRQMIQEHEHFTEKQISR